MSPNEKPMSNDAKTMRSADSTMIACEKSGAGTIG